MATRSASITQRDDLVYVITWQGLVGSADDGAGVGVANLCDLTVQVVGDFGSSGAVTMQGSNDGTTWGTLNDEAGNAVTLSDSSVIEIEGSPLYLRPNGSAGSAADMDVIVTGKQFR